MTHEPEPRDEVEPIAKFRYELARKQITKISIPTDQLAVRERLHLSRIAEPNNFAKQGGRHHCANGALI